MLQYCFCFVLVFCGQEAYRILAPHRGWNLLPLYWKVKSFNSWHPLHPFLFEAPLITTYGLNERKTLIFLKCGTCLRQFADWIWSEDPCHRSHTPPPLRSSSWWQLKGFSRSQRQILEDGFRNVSKEKLVTFFFPLPETLQAQNSKQKSNWTFNKGKGKFQPSSLHSCCPQGGEKGQFLWAREEP